MNGEKCKCNSGIGDRVRRLRFDNGLTQAEVAQRIGVTQQTYSRYEGEGAKLDSEVIVKLCELYGVTADYILGIEAVGGKSGAEKLSLISDGDVDAIVDRVISKLKSDKEDL